MDAELTPEQARALAFVDALSRGAPKNQLEAHLGFGRVPGAAEFQMQSDAALRQCDEWLEFVVNVCRVLEDYIAGRPRQKEFKLGNKTNDEPPEPGDGPPPPPIKGGLDTLKGRPVDRTPAERLADLKKTLHGDGAESEAASAGARAAGMAAEDAAARKRSESAKKAAKTRAAKR